jgi:hypothetical protein
MARKRMIHGNGQDNTLYTTVQHLSLRRGKGRPHRLIECGHGDEIHNFVFAFRHSTNHTTEAAKVRFITFEPD